MSVPVVACQLLHRHRCIRISGYCDCGDKKHGKVGDKVRDKVGDKFLDSGMNLNSM